MLIDRLQQYGCPPPNNLHSDERIFKTYPTCVLMADRERRGMLIKNTGSKSVRVAMASRIIRLGPGDERFITPEEVRDPMLRESLQKRTIAIVRPATPQEDEALQERLTKSPNSG